MFEKVIKAIQTNGLRGAALDMYIYPNGEFTVVPTGQSSKKEWIGSRNLDYKIKGDIHTMDVESILDKIIEGLFISATYEEKGILAKETNVEGTFIEKARNDNFKNYNKISFVLLEKTKTIRINPLTCINSKRDEWVGERENSREFSIDDCLKIKEIIKKSLNSQSR